MRRKATAGNAALAKKAAIQPFYSLLMLVNGSDARSALSPSLHAEARGARPANPAAQTAAPGKQTTLVEALPAPGPPPPAPPTAPALTAPALPAPLWNPVRSTSLPSCWNRRHSAARINRNATRNGERTAGMQMARRPSESWLHRWQRWHRLRHLGYLRSSASLPTRLVGLWRQSIPWFICAATKGYDNYICDFQGKMGHPPLPRRPDAVGGGRAVAR